ncbi:hypothetical protein EI77_02310 [Prosthecobacter fusiformis]|uniref:Uncharacterized protein n=1 Tax=Prosthecobacter fusiformis TaxID=48464 RepID=A0A4R7S1A7_9BACT|nr:hypothetical protein EI77_02310 [Prosthecobacter fusiformis]
MRTLLYFQGWWLIAAILSTNIVLGQSTVDPNDQTVERLIEPLFDSNFQMRKADEALRELASLPGITETL